MKKISILLFASIIALTSCQKNVTDSNLPISESRVQEIAIKYHLSVSKSNIKADTTVRSQADLINLLEKLEQPTLEKTKTFGNLNTVNIAAIEMLKKNYKIANTKNRGAGEKSQNPVLIINKEDVPPPPGEPTKYSTSVYFDNPFPSPNYYLTINYNADENGNIGTANVTTGNWGNSFSMGTSIYNQGDVSIYTKNGSLVFEVKGTYITTVGIKIGDVGLTYTSTTLVTFTGFMQTSGYFGNISGGSVKESLKQLAGDDPVAY